jgi:hypothetical protein
VPRALEGPVNTAADLPFSRRHISRIPSRVPSSCSRRILNNTPTASQTVLYIFLSLSDPAQRRDGMFRLDLDIYAMLTMTGKTKGREETTRAKEGVTSCGTSYRNIADQKFLEGATPDFFPLPILQS